MAVHELIETGTAPDTVTISGDRSAVRRLLAAVRIP
jgi:hypothetical protein